MRWALLAISLLLVASAAAAQGPPEPITLRSVKGSDLTPAEADDDIENLLHLFTGADKASVASPLFSFYVPGEAALTATDCDAATEARQIRLDTTAWTLVYCDGTSWIPVARVSELHAENHAARHSLAGADQVTATNLASGCTDAQVLGGTVAGTGVECQTDDDVPESGDFGAATDLDADGSVSANAVALGTDTTGGYAASTTEAGGATSLEAGALDALTEIAGTLCGTSEILEDQGASWACIATPGGGGTPGGSTTQIQYNNAGAFGGTAGLTWANATGLLSYAPTLDEATGTEYALDLTYTVNKAAGNDRGLRLNMVDTSSPGSSWPLEIAKGGTTNLAIVDTGEVFASNGSAGSTSFSFLNVGGNHGMYYNGGTRLAGSPTIIEANQIRVAQFNTAASGVNYMDLTPAATGTGPLMQAAGTDTNINLRLSGKGTGAVTVQGCRNYGKLSAAPSGAACDTYYDTDVNRWCFHNGTSWLQIDDSTTGCS